MLGTFLKWANTVFAEDGNVTLMVPSSHHPKVLLLVYEKISGETNLVGRTFLEVLHECPSQDQKG